MDFGILDFGIFGLNGKRNPNATGYESQCNGIRIPTEWDTNPNGMGYESQRNGIRFPMQRNTNPNGMGYESQGDGILIYFKLKLAIYAFSNEMGYESQ